MKRMTMAAFAAAVAVLAGGAAPAAAQQLKIGFVNSQRVLAEAPGLQGVQATLERELSPFRTEVDSLERSLEAQNQALQQQASTLSEAVRTQRQQELQQRFGAYQQRLTQLNQMAQQRQSQLVGPVMTQINEAVEAVRREGSFSFIVDASSGFVVAADPALDVTDRVIARLRTMPAPPAAPPASTTPPRP